MCVCHSVIVMKPYHTLLYDAILDHKLKCAYFPYILYPCVLYLPPKWGLWIIVPTHVNIEIGHSKSEYIIPGT